MHQSDYKDLLGGTEKTNQTTKAAAANPANVAHLLANEPYLA